MSIHFNGKKIKEMYFNGKKISEAYFNGEKVYAGKPLFCCYHLRSSSQYMYYTEEIKSTGTYSFYFANDGAIATSSSDLVNRYSYQVVSVTDTTITIDFGFATTLTFDREKENDLYN